MRKNLSKTADFILTRAAIFAVVFVWARYYIEDVWVTLAAAAAGTLAVNLALQIIFGFRKKKRGLKRGEAEKVAEMGNQFLLNTSEENLMFFSEAFQKEEGCNIVALNDCLVAKKEDKTVLVAPYYNAAPLSRQSVIEFIRYGMSIKADEILILCLSKEKNIEAFCASMSDIKVKIYDPVKTYALLKTYDAYPEINRRIKTKRKLSFKEILSYALTRARTKAYIVSGLFLFAISFFTFYRIYYLISASVVIFIGLLSYFNKRHNEAVPKNLRVI